MQVIRTRRKRDGMRLSEDAQAKDPTSKSKDG